MKKQKACPPTRRGSGLIFAIILMFVILAMVVTLSSVTVLETKMSQKSKSSVGAFYNADSGVEWALNRIANNSGTIISVFSTFSGGKTPCPSGFNCDVFFLDSAGKVITDSSTNISLVKAVRSVGTQNTGEVTQRAIEAAVAAGLPSGMIAMFNTSCPLDWTQFSDLNSKLVVGSTTYNASAGSYTVGTGATTVNYANVVWCKKN